MKTNLKLIRFSKGLFSSENEKIKNKFNFVREEIEIRLESLKTELDNLANELQLKLTQMEADFKK